MPQTEDIEYIKKYEAYDCINDSEDDDFDPLDELYEPDPVEIQNTSQNPFTAKVFDPETMFFDLAEARKTETKFRENILSMMMSVLISSDKPNALLCGPAGCGKTKIVEELAYRLKTARTSYHSSKAIGYMPSSSLISWQIQVLWATLKTRSKCS